MESSKGIQEILAKYDVSPWLLDPRSKRMKRWDSIIALALLYTALLTPYEIAFLDMKPASKIDVKLSSFVLYCINWCVAWVDILGAVGRCLEPMGRGGVGIPHAAALHARPFHSKQWRLRIPTLLAKQGC